MKMEKKKFRIGQLAEDVGVERFVIRFWEKEFGLSSSRSTGGQRFYTETDLDLFKRIKTLLYDEGFTITGAKKKLTETTQYTHSHTETTSKKQDRYAKRTEWDQNELRESIITLKEQLTKLKGML